MQNLPHKSPPSQVGDVLRRDKVYSTERSLQLRCEQAPTRDQRPGTGPGTKPNQTQRTQTKKPQVKEHQLQVLIVHAAFCSQRVWPRFIMCTLKQNSVLVSAGSNRNRPKTEPKETKTQAQTNERAPQTPLDVKGSLRQLCG